MKLTIYTLQKSKYPSHMYLRRIPLLNTCLDLSAVELDTKHWLGAVYEVDEFPDFDPTAECICILQEKPIHISILEQSNLSRACQNNGIILLIWDELEKQFGSKSTLPFEAVSNKYKGKFTHFLIQYLALPHLLDLFRLDILYTDYKTISEAVSKSLAAHALLEHDPMYFLPFVEPYFKMQLKIDKNILFPAAVEQAWAELLEKYAQKYWLRRDTTEKYNFMDWYIWISHLKSNKKREFGSSAPMIFPDNTESKIERKQEI